MCLGKNYSHVTKIYRNNSLAMWNVHLSFSSYTNGGESKDSMKHGVRIG